METLISKSKWIRGYIGIALIGVLLISFIATKSQTEYEAKLHAYQTQANAEAEFAAAQIGNTFNYIYQGIRTISHLPSIRQLNDNGTNLSPDARESIRFIYENMATNVEVSEIYITLADFNPLQKGPKSAPVLMFDHHAHSQRTSQLPEIEDEEHQLILKQMNYFKKNYPLNSSFEHLKTPFISGPSVITCDNTKYAQTMDNADRLGLVFSVPFYDTKGALRGAISAIILNHALKERLTDAHYALINKEHNYRLTLPAAPQEITTNPGLQHFEADKALLFSSTKPIKTTDPQSQWHLWVGYPDSVFLKSDNAKVVEKFRIAGYGLSLLLIVMAAVVWTLQKRSFEVIDRLNHSLEEKVSERTQKLESLTIDLQKSLQAAKEANEAKGNFLANMSHELRTPMNGVLGMSYLLAQTKLTEEQNDLVSTINSSAEALLALLNDILDFSKIEAGALQLENLAHDFHNILDKTTALLKPQAEKKGLELQLEYAEAVPTYIWGDPARLRQIIINLLGNAIKFTQKGHVKVSVATQLVDGKDMLRVSVDDTGVGIPADKLDHIFEKFTQADESITRNYGGTGLGLTISRHLVEMMGGVMGVSSTEGSGSTFWFRIPLECASQSDLLISEDDLPEQQNDANLTPITDAKVLLVEDYNINAIFAEKILRKFGIKDIDVVTDGLQAILRCQVKNYDIIFMDCQMPELDGYRATEELRHKEWRNGSHIPIVAMTANAMVGDREKCLRAGMDDYISKPIRVQHLKKVLHRWFRFSEEKDLQQEVKAVTSAQPAPVNLEQFNMFTDGDSNEKKELFDLFMDQTNHLLSILEQNLGEDGREAWKSAAHRLKGSSGNLGAMPLHDLSRTAEINFEQDLTHKKIMLAAIREELQRVENFMKTV